MLPSFPPVNLLGLWRPLTCYARPAMRAAFRLHYGGHKQGSRRRQQSRNCGETCSVKREVERVAIFLPESREDLRFG